jgi:type I restriction enzyme M protein
MLVEALRPGSLKGTNGQFRTPRHIIELMVAMTEPTPRDVMVDPACGTCGFPVAVGEYLREHHPEVLSDPELREHFNHGLFHGFDFDNTMLRIGAMNMLLHGVENPDVSYRDSLSEDGAEEQDKYTLILANPPFAGSLDYESTSGKLQRVVKTKKTERRVPPLCRREHRDPVLHQNQPWRHRPRLVL